MSESHGKKKRVQRPLEQTDGLEELMGWFLATLGTGGVLAGIATIYYEPKNPFGYAYASAAAGLLVYGVRKIRQT